MRMVLDIPEEVFDEIYNKNYYSLKGKEALRVAVRNGTPLPKGHGDLKDVNKLKEAFIKWGIALQGSFTDSDIANIVYNSPTIIEADKESEQEWKHIQ